MMLGQEKKRHRQGCGLFAYDDLAAESLDEQNGKKIRTVGALQWIRWQAPSGG